jgi:hypothetical protein
MLLPFYIDDMEQEYTYCAGIIGQWLESTTGLANLKKLALLERKIAMPGRAWLVALCHG